MGSAHSVISMSKFVRELLVTNNEPPELHIELPTKQRTENRNVEYVLADLPEDPPQYLPRRKS